jgi:hypothetical protein
MQSRVFGRVSTIAPTQNVVILERSEGSAFAVALALLSVTPKANLLLHYLRIKARFCAIPAP